MLWFTNDRESLTTWPQGGASPYFARATVCFPAVQQTFGVERTAESARALVDSDIQWAPSFERLPEFGRQWPQCISS